MKQIRMRRLLRLGFALFSATVLAAGWYAYDKGFTKKWRTYVTAEARKRGFEITLRRMTLEPWRGIVAKEVKLYDARDRKRVVAVVDEVRLVINYANVFQGKPFLEALDLRDANLALPLDSKNPRGLRLEIHKLSGRLLLPPQQLYLSNLDADFHGVHVTARGRLIRPEALQRTSPDTDNSMLLAIIERVVNELKALHFEAGAPAVDIRFSGDLAAPEQLFVEATFWAEKMRRTDYRLENVYAAASLRNGVVAVQQLIANDARGVLRASGSRRLATGETSFQLDSTLDLHGLGNAFRIAPLFNDLIFYSPPQLDLHATWADNIPGGWRSVGRVAFGRFAYRAVPFEKLDADFSFEGDRWSVRTMRLVHRTGELAGDALQDGNDLHSRFTNTVNPTALSPILNGKLGELYSRLTFVNPS
jgi:hypothetical protein